MSKNTELSRFMGKFRRKLNRVVDLHLRACGHEGEVQKALHQQWELEMFVDDEVGRLRKTIEDNKQNRGPG